MLGGDEMFNSYKDKLFHWLNFHNYGLYKNMSEGELTFRLLADPNFGKDLTPEYGLTYTERELPRKDGTS